MKDSDRLRLNLSVTSAAVAVACILIAAKFWALQETSALSMAASLVDSALDLMISLAGLAAISYAARPPDKDHSFGHTAVEDLVALGQCTFILGSAAVISWKAVKRLFGHAPVEISSEGQGITVIALSILLGLGLVLWQSHVVKKTGSPVVAADRLHYVGDLAPNIGVIIALWASGRYGITWIDSIVALLAAAILVYGALKIGGEAWNGLMDRAPDPKLIKAIERLASDWPGIQGFHDLQTRRNGSKVFVNLHLEIDGGLSLDEAHEIGDSLRREIERKYPQTDVLIHKDPV